MSWRWWLFGAGLVAADILPMSNVEEFDKLAKDNRGFPHQTFRSSSIVAPIWNVRSWNKSLTDDDLHLFIGGTYKKVGGTGGPMIFDGSDLSLIYADQNYDRCDSSEVQTIHGKRHLGFFSQGQEWVYDETYRLKYHVHGQGRVGTDMHELHVTDEGTAVFTAGGKIDYNCSSWGGAEKCKIRDTGFQEVDLKDNKVLFEWVSLDHNDPHDTYARIDPGNFGMNKQMEGTWDMVHTNGVRKDEEGNYVVSHRHLSCIQYINGSNGDVIWTLGGKSNMFKDLSNGQATNIGWQHNPRWYKNLTHLTMFDNHGEGYNIQGSCDDPNTPCVSRGLHLELDTVAMTARVVREFYHPDKINSGAMGSMQVLENENVLIGWGWTPSYVEYTPDGDVAMDIQRGIIGITRQGDMWAYRAYKSRWTGRPTWPPSVVVDSAPKDGGEATVYMSWNGATDIKKWQVFTSDESSPSQLVQLKNRIAEVGRAGFETAVDVDPKELKKYVNVAAFDKDGTLFGISEAFNVTALYEKEKAVEEIAKAKEEADKAKTEADKAKGEADKAKAEAEQAKADAQKAAEEQQEEQTLPDDHHDDEPTDEKLADQPVDQPADQPDDQIAAPADETPPEQDHVEDADLNFLIPGAIFGGILFTLILGAMALSSYKRRKRGPGAASSRTKYMPILDEAKDEEP